MIWSDRDILRELRLGERARVEPFDEKAVQPASIDLRLGKVFWKYKSYEKTGNLNTIIDVREPVKPLMERIEDKAVLLWPQCFLLGSTIEKVTLGNTVIARVEGKSSLGRLGLTIHSTAGFIDPGNADLSITVELFNQSPFPIKLYAGMWICQLAFSDMLSPCERPYGSRGRNSRYFGDAEPVPSRLNENSGI